MEKARVGINGFGRIARTIYRINKQLQMFDIVAINEINPDINNVACLLQYDSTYGRLDEKVTTDGNDMIVGNKKVRIYQHENIKDVPWDDHEIDFIIDASGLRAHLERMESSPSKVKNTFVTNSPSDFDNFKTIVFGVNENDTTIKDSRIISTSICDTIAMSPIIVALSERNEIESGFLTTLPPMVKLSKPFGCNIGFLVTSR